MEVSWLRLLKGRLLGVHHRSMRYVCLCVCASCVAGWWHSFTPPDATRPASSKPEGRLEQFTAFLNEKVQDVTAGVSKVREKAQTIVASIPTDMPYFDSGLWFLVDTVFGFIGWTLFGSAWAGVKTGCKRIAQILVVLALCLIAHYIWAVCWPIVSLCLGCMMTVVWLLRRILKLMGTGCFYVQKWSGGVPEASDVEFYGPSLGSPTETAILRLFKRTGDAEKLAVVKQDGLTAVP